MNKALLQLSVSFLCDKFRLVHLLFCGTLKSARRIMYLSSHISLALFELCWLFYVLFTTPRNSACKLREALVNDRTTHLNLFPYLF